MCQRERRIMEPCCVSCVTPLVCGFIAAWKERTCKERKRDRSIQFEAAAAYMVARLRVALSERLLVRAVLPEKAQRGALEARVVVL